MAVSNVPSRKNVEGVRPEVPGEWVLSDTDGSTVLRLAVEGEELARLDVHDVPALSISDLPLKRLLLVPYTTVRF